MVNSNIFYLVVVAAVAAIADVVAFDVDEVVIAAFAVAVYFSGFSFKNNLAKNCFDCDKSCDCCNCVNNYFIIGNIFFFVVFSAVFLMLMQLLLLLLLLSYSYLDLVSKTILPKIV